MSTGGGATGHKSTGESSTSAASAHLSKSNVNIENKKQTDDTMDLNQFMEQFKQAFINTMKDAEGQESLRNVMKPLVQENTENIAKLSQVVVRQKQKIEILECEVEILKQQMRNKTIVVNGIAADPKKETVDQVTALCKDKLKINLHPMDIDKVYAIKTNKNNTTGRSIYVSLTTTRKKDEIMKAKKLLRDLDDDTGIIYINEYLTQKQGELFAKARGLVKKKKLIAAWTRDGKVFVKEEEGGNPKSITITEQLLKYEKAVEAT